MMSKICRFAIVFFFGLNSVHAIAQQKEWNKKTAQEWFNKMEWLKSAAKPAVEVKYDNFGRVIEEEVPNKTTAAVLKIKPHPSINVVEFAKQYHARQSWWNEVFSFIQQINLDTLHAGKYVLDEDNVIYTVVEGPARKMDTTKWESHLKYQDIHFIIKGRERVGISDSKAAEVVSPYNSERDIIFYNKNGKYEIAQTGDLFIFFPGELHRPNLAVQENEYVKKIVFKVKRSEQ